MGCRAHNRWQAFAALIDQSPDIIDAVALVGMGVGEGQSMNLRRSGIQHLFA
jgi:hypothetical protein